MREEGHSVFLMPVTSFFEWRMLMRRRSFVGSLAGATLAVAMHPNAPFLQEVRAELTHEPDRQSIGPETELPRLVVGSTGSLWIASEEAGPNGDTVYESYDFEVRNSGLWLADESRDFLDCYPAGGFSLEGNDLWLCDEEGAFWLHSVATPSELYHLS